MSVTHSHLGSCFRGSRAYIYILYSLNQRALYVGQTAERHGVIGRLCGHIATDGTLRTRLYEHGVELNEVDDLTVFAYCLPEDPRYIGIESAYRQGVEFLVQKGLRMGGGPLHLPLRIVSNIAYNDAAAQPMVIRAADQVLAAFIAAYTAPRP
jgi:hypothetical protein